LTHDPLTFQLTTGAPVVVVASICTGVPAGASKVSGLDPVVSGAGGMTDRLAGVRDGPNNAPPTTTAATTAATTATAASVASFRRVISATVASAAEPVLPCRRNADDEDPLKAAPIVFTSLNATSTARTSRIRPTKLGRAVLIFFVALAVAGCDSSHSPATGPRLLTARQLTTRILPAPYGYRIDPTPHSSGVMTRALFDQFGGVRSPSKLGFVTGFRQSYLNLGTEEALIVTVIEFRAARDASAYFAQTRPSTLSYAGATVKPFHGVPGAFEAVGTKLYNNGYYHAIFDATNDFYFQIAYASPEPSSAPVELGAWAGLEYRVLKRS